jgi:iron complex transport system substrate-binding protein
VNRYLKVFLPFLLSLAIFLSPACSQKTETPTKAAIEVTDQLGRTIRLDTLPQRIISIAPANTEILYALGIENRIVAVTDYCNYPPEVKDKSSVGGFSTPNIEKIVALTPDLVLAAPIHEVQIIPQLEAKGINVLALTPTTIDEVLKAITLVGRVTGSEKKANDLVAGMQKQIKTVIDKTGSLSVEQRPSVLFIIWHDPLMASGLNTFHDELIKKAGGVNTVTDEGYPSINLETVIQFDPAIILAGVGMGEGMDAPLKFAQEESRLRDITARKNNRVYGVDTDTSGRAGPRIVDALEKFARLIHPELFK